MNVKRGSGSKRDGAKNERDQMLLQVLVTEAERRGDTLTALAKYLGVTYSRLAQWRRNDADIASASQAVHERAALYLGVPTVLVLVMAKKVLLADFVWPAKEKLEVRVTRELREMAQDPFIGQFMPMELAQAPLTIRLFVVFLIRELRRDGTSDSVGLRWIRALELATLAGAESKEELHKLRADAKVDERVF